MSAFTLNTTDHDGAGVPRATLVPLALATWLAIVVLGLLLLA